jgi:Lon protease-like protein
MKIPLFPLNTVLFPGLPIQLHIFEPRYKQMIRECVATESPFGVVLIRQGREALGPVAQPYDIGCTAQIISVERTPGDRFNITAVGKERFEIIALDTVSQPYLMGTVEMLEMDEAYEPMLNRSRRHLSTWLRTYVDILSQASDSDFDFSKLPNAPVRLAYLAASLLQNPNREKQSLLATNDPAELIDELIEHYRRETPLLRKMVGTEPKMQGMFGIN